MNARRSGPRNAQDRLRQLLVMLPWLMEAGEVPLADVAERFGLTEAQVTKDLELVAMCGLPPYVDEMIDVFVDEGMVFVGVPRLFTRPLRLTAPEGFALLASGRAAMELPGADPEGPLARGLDKLAGALGQAGLDTSDDRTAGVVVDLERPVITERIIDAAARGAELVLEYFSPSRGESSTRTVVPRHVFADAGNWYLLADDDRSGERRTFRIDRIESVAETGIEHEPDPAVAAPSAFFIDADLPRARLRLAPPAQWITEHYPVDSVEPVTGRVARSSPDSIEVVLPVASEWWLDRLLVRLGPAAEILEPADGGDGAARLAAAILANYD
ncbi:helix-turn-helix transcriptional regulator [Ilumatobacter sp.]|uniref:helix-turn-helix transcriptional regulator n=1 Tax=Ilumatobacter sp. TaxID=1967498 RepID=UPI003C531258